MERYKNYIAWFYIMSMFFVIPLYNHGTYDSISQRKVEAFFLIGGLTILLYIIVSVLSDMKNKEASEKKKHSLSETDYAMSIFLFSAVISFALSGYKKEAAYGIPGFGMGCLAISVMVLSYFLISVYLSADERMLHLIVASSVVPTALACINRMGYDPLKLYEPGEDPISNLYVSTFGNYSWYSHYLVMIIPVAVYVFLSAGSVRVRVIYAVYLAMALWSLIVAGTTMAMIVCALIIPAYFILTLLRKYALKNRSKKALKRIGNIAACIVILLFGIYAVAVISCSRSDIGNGRGYFWYISADLFRELPLTKKMVGVGPNCYMCAVDEYIQGHEDEAGRFYEMTQNLALTSSHSEYLDYLINMGVFGCLSYLAVIILSVRSFLESGIGNRIRETAFLCCLSYLVYSAANFSIVCATPYFFIFLGIISGKSKNEYKI